MRRKLAKFEENKQNPYILEPEKPIYETIKGNWQKEFFKNQQPITLELACGAGEYTTGLGGIFPDRNFIGVDIKGDRIWQGIENATNKNLKNVGFLRTKIHFIEKFFEKGEVDQIWIVFPDPQLQTNRVRRRLTNPVFLEKYRNICTENAQIHLKTDNLPFFNYTLEVLKDQKITDLVYTHDLYQSVMLADHFGIQTRYEKHFMAKGFKINYLNFRFLK
ncbi:MAG: tRNA (guanosine(46)-N7)-methyltransferase TrmB [Bacteroidetes bacterium]|nr:MAG: tRNA (guanosine(46)-N7)-methyltransferase TrmB [Bacteroidota bacterium]